MRILSLIHIFYISNRVFELLLQYEFPANIEQLKNCIQTSCANALVQSNDQTKDVSVYLYHLPEYLMAMARVGNEFSEEQRSMINVRSFVKDAMTETINQYYESILDEFDQYRVQQYEQGALLQKLTKCFNAYSDYLVFSKRFANAKIDVIERVMENVFHLLTDKYYLCLLYTS